MTTTSIASKSLVVVLLALMLVGSFLLVFVPTVQDAHASGGISIDGTPATSPNCASPCTFHLSTSDSNDIIVVVFIGNLGLTVSSVTDTGSAGLTFAVRFVCAGDTTGSIGRTMCEYYSGPTPAPLSSEAITLATSGSGDVLIFAVNGADTGSPWDPNPSLPVESAGPSGTACSVSTSNANDMLLSYAADGGSPVFTVPAQSGGYTAITSSFGLGPTAMGAYDVVSSTQSSVQTSWTYTAGTADYQELCDAIQGPVTQQVQCSMQAGVPSIDDAVLTLSDSDGSTPSPSSLSCNGTPIVVTVDPSTTLTATEPSDGANARYRFTGPSTTTTDSICSSGACSGWSFTDYYQLLNTYQASPDVPNKWTTGGLAIDGTVTEGGAACSTGCTADLTTARANDILIVMIQANPGATVSSVTDTGTAGLTFSTRFACAGSARTLCEYYSSPVSSALASEPIKITSSPSESQFEAIIFGVNGANTGSPWDANGALPNEATNSKSCSMTTSNPNDMLLTEIGDGNGPTFTVPSGFAQVTAQVGSGFSGMAAYHVVSSTQTGASVTWTESGGSATPETLCDAIQAASPIITTGTSAGMSGQTICTMGAPSYGASTVVSCSGWADYDTAVSMGTLTMTPNARWYPITASYTDTTGGNTHTDNYYEQLQNTYQAPPFSPSSWVTSSLALDGSGSNGCATGSCGNTLSTTLSTSDTNDVVVLFCASITANVNAPSDSAGLTWIQRGTELTSANRISSIYYAVSSGTLTSDSISCNYSGTALDTSMTVWAVNGANLASPWDPNSNLPNNNGFDVANPSCTMATSNANDFLFTVVLSSGAWSANPSGFSTINQINTGANGYGGNYAAYDIVSSTQSSVTEAFTIALGRGNIWCDAIQAASIDITGTFLGTAGSIICVTASPTSGTSTVASCTGWADYDTVVTMGVLTVNSNQRWSPVTATYTDTGGGNTHADDYYEQFQNTYQALDGNGVNWDVGLSAAVTGTVLGTAGSTVCTITPTSGGTVTAACTGFSDWDKAVAFPSTLSGAPVNSQWKWPGGPPVVTTTGGNTYTASYYKQLQNTYAASPSAPTTFTGSITFSVTGTSLGAAAATICTVSVPPSPSAGSYSCAGYADYDTAVSMPATSGATPANVRWEASGTTSFTDITGGNTRATSYYEQLQNTYQAIPSVPSTWDASFETLALDGSAECGATVAHTCSMTFTTSDSYDVIYVMTYVTSAATTIGAPSSSSPGVSGCALLGSQLHLAASSFNMQDAYCTAATPGSLTLACNASASTDIICVAVGINGAWSGAGSPNFDTNSANVNACPRGVNSGSPATCNYKSSNANDLMIACEGIQANSQTDGQAAGSIAGTGAAGIAIDSGEAGIQTGGCEYLVEGSTINGAITFIHSGSQLWGIVADGLEAVPTTVTVTGTSLGISGQAICTTGPSAAGSSAPISCSGWADYDTAATMGILTIGANERWAPATLTYTDTGGGGTHTDSYYQQFQNTYEASPSVPNTWDASGLSLDGSAAVVCSSVASCQTSLTTSDTNDLVVAFCAGNAGQTGYAISDGASLTWQQRGSVLTGAGGDVIGAFYAVSSSKLTADPITCTNVPAGSHNIVVSVFAVNGANLVTPFDPSLSLPNTNSAASGTTPSCTMSTSNGNDLLFTYMGHPANTITSAPSGLVQIQTTGGSPSSYTAYEVVSSTQSSVAESWVLSSSGHWATWCDAIQGKVASLAVTGTLTGVAGQTICLMLGPVSGTSTATSCTGFTDYDTAATMGTLAVSSTERWVPANPTYTDTGGGNTHLDGYTDQFQVSFVVSPAGTGTTSPSGTNVWENYGALSITGTPNSGYAFSVWSSMGSILFGNQASSSTTAILAGTGTITATFAPTVTLASVSDGYVFSDGASRVVIATRPVPDGAAFAEGITVQGFFTRSGSDSFVFVDSLATQVSALRNAVDSFVMSDSPLRGVDLTRSVSDAISLIEGALGALAISRSVLDSVPFSETIIGNTAFLRTAADSLVFSETSLVMTVLGRAIADAYVLSDLPSRALSLFQSVGDAIVVSDASSAYSALVRGIADAFPTFDQSAANSILARAAADVYSYSDSAIRGLGLGAAVSDAVGFLEGAQTLLTFSRGAADSYVVSVAYSGVSNLVRGVVDSFPISDVVSRSLQLFGALQDAYTYIDGLETQTQNLEHLLVLVADSFVTSDAASRTTLLTRLVSDAVTFASVAQRQLDLFRSVLDGFVVQSVQSRLLSLFASVTDAVKTAVNSIGSVTSSVSSITSSISSTISSITSSLSSSLTSSSRSSTSGGQHNLPMLMVSLVLLFVLLIGLPIFFIFGRRGRKKKEPRPA